LIDDHLMPVSLSGDTFLFPHLDILADKSRSTHSTSATCLFYWLRNIRYFSTAFNTFQQIGMEDSAFSTIYYYFFYIFNKYIIYKVLYISYLTYIVEC